MSTIDVVSRRRSGLLLIGAVAFATWQVAEVGYVQHLLDRPVLRMVTPFAILLWICSMVPLVTPVVERSKGAAEDELTRHNRLTAFSWGYWVMIVAAVVVLALTTRGTMPAVDLIRLMLIGGVAAPMIRFAIMERPTPDGE